MRRVHLLVAAPLLVAVAVEDNFRQVLPFLRITFLILLTVNNNNNSNSFPTSMLFHPMQLLLLLQALMLNRRHGCSLVAASTIQTILVFRVELRRAAAVAVSSMERRRTNHFLS